jgi:hypothetical protein
MPEAPFGHATDALAKLLRSDERRTMKFHPGRINCVQMMCVALTDAVASA